MPARPVPQTSRRSCPLIAVAAILLLVFISPASAQAGSPTLENETVFGVDTFQVEPGSTCAADGSGTINFSASGTASGPFPGELTTTGTVTLGPTPPPQGAITDYSPVTGFSATFTITSGSTTITGTGSLGEPEDTRRWGTFDLVNKGECLGGQFTANQFGVGVRYTATIDTPDGAFADHGFGHAFGAKDRFIRPTNLFQQEFASLSGKTAPDAPTNVIAAAGDGSASVSWLPPASDGGTPIRRYTVTASPGGQTAVGGQSATVTGLTNGVPYTFTVTATNAVGEGPSSAPSNEVTPEAGNVAPAVVVGSASPTQPTQVSTDGAGGLATSILVPAGTAGGLVSIIQTGVTGPAPSGFSFVGRQFDITAPAASAANPLELSFLIDQSLLDEAGVDATSVQIFRDGVPVGACDAGAPGATPDPCVARREVPEWGGAEITVRSSHASTWNVGRRAAFTPTGFFQPVDPLPNLNTVKAGSAIPVRFGLGGDRGLDVFADGYPKSAPISCNSTAPVDAIEQTVTAGRSSLSYDPATDRYTYAWKTDKAWSAAPGGPCRQLVLEFVDGSTMKANFKFQK